MPLPPLPACSRAAYLASLGHPRQPGRWTRQAAMVALGLYVREEHRLPPQRHLHNSECLPSYDTVLALFGTPQAYYEALPPAWTLPLLPVARTPRGPNHYAPTPRRPSPTGSSACDVSSGGTARIKPSGISAHAARSRKTTMASG